MRKSLGLFDRAHRQREGSISTKFQVKRGAQIMQDEKQGNTHGIRAVIGNATPGGGRACKKKKTTLATIPRDMMRGRRGGKNGPVNGQRDPVELEP
jgi:hypothetical protein